MSLMLRRRMLMAQQDDGNLANVSLSGRVRCNVSKIDNGYVAEVTEYSSAYNQYVRLNLTTAEISNSLWGKKIRVSANISNTNEQANPLYRLGYTREDGSWVKWLDTTTLNDGVVVIEYTLPNTRPDNMSATKSMAFLVNVQRTDVTPLNIMTITNIRLEVIE